MPQVVLVSEPVTSTSRPASCVPIRKELRLSDDFSQPQLFYAILEAYTVVYALSREALEKSACLSKGAESRSLCPLAGSSDASMRLVEVPSMPRWRAVPCFRPCEREVRGRRGKGEGRGEERSRESCFCIHAAGLSSIICNSAQRLLFGVAPVPCPHSRSALQAEHFFWLAAFRNLGDSAPERN
jgi:hypothetical protein